MTLLMHMHAALADRFIGIAKVWEWGTRNITEICLNLHKSQFGIYMRTQSLYRFLNYCTYIMNEL